ncbi:MAG: AmmeMemoRadiSam system protein A, partial [Verrucomicrobia bacterium]
SRQRRLLLNIARAAITEQARGRGAPPRAGAVADAALNRPAACFVTLEKFGELRGCIGDLEPRLPLWMAVHENARAAAARDPRFPPVSVEELPDLSIEISVLSTPVPLEAGSPEAVMRALRPGRDGVILEVGGRRATFLPQVWEKVPDAESFLTHLSLKACGDPTAWRDPQARFAVYTVESFDEREMDERGD